MNATRQKKVTKLYSVSLERKKSYVLPAGRYFIGDPSYFLHNSLMAAACEGHYALPDGRGYILVGSNDGIWSGSDGKVYSVESGLIGICSYDIGNMSNFTGDGTFHTFGSEVGLEFDSGVVRVKSGDWVLEIDVGEECVLSDDDGYDSYS